jgi:hypothetical protein
MTLAMATAVRLTRRLSSTISLNFGSKLNIIVPAAPRASVISRIIQCYVNPVKSVLLAAGRTKPPAGR